MQKYLAVFRYAFIHSLKNTKVLIGLSIFLITCMIIFAHLWQIAAIRMGAMNLQPDQLLWYIAFNQWVLVALPGIEEDMEDDLRSGRLAYLLPRPISYLLATFFEGLGTLCVNLIVLGVVTFAYTWIKVGHMPFAFSVFPITLFMGFLAGCVGLVIHMLIGLSAFWFHSVNPFHWVWEKLLFTLGGLMLPLTVYPIWLQKIANFTPFPAILGNRSALAIHFDLSDLLYVTANLLLWGLLAVTCLVLVYRKGLKIVNIGGG